MPPIFNAYRSTQISTRVCMHALVQDDQDCREKASLRRIPPNTTIVHVTSQSCHSNGLEKFSSCTARKGLVLVLVTILNTSTSSADEKDVNLRLDSVSHMSPTQTSTFPSFTSQMHREKSSVDTCAELAEKLAAVRATTLTAVSFTMSEKISPTHPLFQFDARKHSGRAISLFAHVCPCPTRPVSFAMLHKLRQSLRAGAR